MALQEIFQKTRSGVFLISFIDGASRKSVASGTAFLCNGHLVTNHHVFLGPQSSAVFITNDSGTPSNVCFTTTYADFKSRLKSGSVESSYDFAILDIPEISGDDSAFKFELDQAAKTRVGDEVVFLGFPFGSNKVTFHAGMVSSLHRNNDVEIIQLDASVNASNSGGPLLDPASGKVIGIITRKATGLTNAFENLKQVLLNNVEFLQSQHDFAIQIGNIDINAALQAGQRQMLITAKEIERQANVGIGYAFSTRHLLEDNLMSPTDF